MGKVTKSKKRVEDSHDPLDIQIRKTKEATPSVKRAMRMRKKRGQVELTGEDTCGHGELENDDDGFALPNKMSTIILQQAREQREEEKMDIDEDGSDVELEYDDASSQATETPFDEPDQDFEIDEEEEKLMQQFAPQSSMATRNLADIIMAKIRSKEREADEVASRRSGSTCTGTQFDPRIVKVYKTVGKLFKRYTTGKIPKAFKVLPNLQGWEELLWLTSPHEWSPHALYAATRLFAHAANEKMAQRYYNTILLPSIRSAFRRNGKLHSHMYASLRKAMWKPAAFNKGFLLPFTGESDLSMKEALIVASLMQKSSMPRQHAVVAIAKMTELPYNGSSSIILRTMIDKKYDMPYQVIDMLVKYFHQFTRESRELPVLWHQCLLTFVQRYKETMLESQVSLIRKTVNKHNHMMISSEVRRELIQLENHWKKVCFFYLFFFFFICTYKPIVR